MHFYFNNCLKTIFFKVNICKLSFFHLIIWVCFPYVHLTAQIFILNNLFCFVYLLVISYIFQFFFDFDGYYIVRTDEGQPRLKYIFNKCGTNIYFFTLQRFGPSPSPNFKFLFTASFGKGFMLILSQLCKTFLSNFTYF